MKRKSLTQKMILFWQEYHVYIIFFILVALTHFTVRLYNDDEYFAKALDDTTIIEFLCFRYEQWTSRIIIEFFLILLTRVPLIWGVLNTLIFLISGYSLIQLLSLDKKKDSCCCALVLGSFFLIPAVAYNGAGWIATTLNYLWPCGLALFAIVPAKKILCKEKVNRWEFVLSIPALVIASNMELVCAFLFAIVLLCMLIYFFQHKRVNFYFVLQILLLSFMLLFIFSCPGNFARSVSEVQTWFPEYDTLSLFRKFEIGLRSTLFQFIFEPNLLFLCFTLLLLTAMLAKHKNVALCAVASIPLLSSIFSFGLKLFSYMGINYFSNLMALKGGLTQIETESVSVNPGTWLSSLFCLFIYAVILLMIVNLFDKRYAFILIYILLTGFATRMAMSLSPTILTSGIRTFWLMMLAIVFCMGALVKLLVYMQYKYRNVIFIIIGCIEACAVLLFWF